MKRIRIRLISLIAFTCAIAQAPSQASCQILPLTSVMPCAMPCCQQRIASMPPHCRCPKLKAAVPQQDAITPHSNFSRIFLNALSLLPKMVVPETIRTFSRNPLAADIVYVLFPERPSLGRAPPADISLLSA